MNILDLYPDRIDTDDETGCWVWKAGVSSEGYGRARFNRKVTYVHRLSYQLSKGEITRGLLIRHSCHNTRCCNPEHLSTGTDRDNYHDSKNAHRDGDMKQSKNWIIDGWIYDNIKDAVSFTGISKNSICKYSINGVFDVEAYRKGCQKANVKPKL